MVQMLRRNPVPVFRVYDRDGRVIGQVVQPASAPVVGRGARTVLLMRDAGDTRGAAPRQTLPAA